MNILLSQTLFISYNVFCLHFEHQGNEPGSDYVQGKLTLALSISGWLKVNLTSTTAVTGIMMQGRGGQSNQWVTTLRVEHSNDDATWETTTVNGKNVSG